MSYSSLSPSHGYTSIPADTVNQYNVASTSYTTNNGHLNAAAPVFQPRKSFSSNIPSERTIDSSYFASSSVYQYPYFEDTSAYSGINGSAVLGILPDTSPFNSNLSPGALTAPSLHSPQMGTMTPSLSNYGSSQGVMQPSPIGVASPLPQSWRNSNQGAGGGVRRTRPVNAPFKTTGHNLKPSVSLTPAALSMLQTSTTRPKRRLVVKLPKEGNAASGWDTGVVAEQNEDHIAAGGSSWQRPQWPARQPLIGIDWTETEPSIPLDCISSCPAYSEADSHTTRLPDFIDISMPVQETWKNLKESFLVERLQRRCRSDIQADLVEDTTRNNLADKHSAFKVSEMTSSQALYDGYTAKTTTEERTAIDSALDSAKEMTLEEISTSFSSLLSSRHIPNEGDMSLDLPFAGQPFGPSAMSALGLSMDREQEQEKERCCSSDSELTTNSIPALGERPKKERCVSDHNNKVITRTQEEKIDSLLKELGRGFGYDVEDVERDALQDDYKEPSHGVDLSEDDTKDASAPEGDTKSVVLQQEKGADIASPPEEEEKGEVVASSENHEKVASQQVEKMEAMRLQDVERDEESKLDANESATQEAAQEKDAEPATLVEERHTLDVPKGEVEEVAPLLEIESLEDGEILAAVFEEGESIASPQEAGTHDQAPREGDNQGDFTIANEAREADLQLENPQEAGNEAADLEEESQAATLTPETADVDPFNKIDGEVEPVEEGAVKEEPDDEQCQKEPTLQNIIEVGIATQEEEDFEDEKKATKVDEEVAIVNEEVVNEGVVNEGVEIAASIKDEEVVDGALEINAEDNNSVKVDNIAEPQVETETELVDPQEEVAEIATIAESGTSTLSPEESGMVVGEGGTMVTLSDADNAIDPPQIEEGKDDVSKGEDNNEEVLDGVDTTPQQGGEEEITAEEAQADGTSHVEDVQESTAVKSETSVVPPPEADKDPLEIGGETALQSQVLSEDIATYNVSSQEIGEGTSALLGDQEKVAPQEEIEAVNDRKGETPISEDQNDVTQVSIAEISEPAKAEVDSDRREEGDEIPSTENQEGVTPGPVAEVIDSVSEEEVGEAMKTQEEEEGALTHEEKVEESKSQEEHDEQVEMQEEVKVDEDLPEEESMQQDVSALEAVLTEQDDATPNKDEQTEEVDASKIGEEEIVGKGDVIEEEQNLDEDAPDVKAPEEEEELNQVEVGDDEQASTEGKEAIVASLEDGEGHAALQENQEAVMHQEQVDKGVGLEEDTVEEVAIQAEDGQEAEPAENIDEKIAIEGAISQEEAKEVVHRQEGSERQAAIDVVEDVANVQAEVEEEPQAQGDTADQVSSEADAVIEASFQADEATEASPQADEAIEASPQADEASKASPQADEAIEASPQADEASEIPHQADEADEIPHQVGEGEEVVKEVQSVEVEEEAGDRPLDSVAMGEVEITQEGTADEADTQEIGDAMDPSENVMEKRSVPQEEDVESLTAEGKGSEEVGIVGEDEAAIGTDEVIESTPEEQEQNDQESRAQQENATSLVIDEKEEKLQEEEDKPVLVKDGSGEEAIDQEGGKDVGSESQEVEDHGLEEVESSEKEAIDDSIQQEEQEMVDIDSGMVDAAVIPVAIAEDEVLSSDKAAIQEEEIQEQDYALPTGESALEDLIAEHNEGEEINNRLRSGTGETFASSSIIHLDDTEPPVRHYSCTPQALEQSITQAEVDQNASVIKTSTTPQSISTPNSASTSPKSTFRRVSRGFAGLDHENPTGSSSYQEHRSASLQRSLSNRSSRGSRRGTLGSAWQQGDAPAMDSRQNSSSSRLRELVQSSDLVPLNDENDDDNDTISDIIEELGDRMDQSLEVWAEKILDEVAIMGQIQPAVKLDNSEKQSLVEMITSQVEDAINHHYRTMMEAISTLSFPHHDAIEGTLIGDDSTLTTTPRRALLQKAEHSGVSIHSDHGKAVDFSPLNDTLNARMVEVQQHLIATIESFLPRAMESVSLSIKEATDSTKMDDIVKRLEEMTATIQLEVGVVAAEMKEALTPLLSALESQRDRSVAIDDQLILNSVKQAVSETLQQDTAKEAADQDDLVARILKAVQEDSHEKRTEMDDIILLLKPVVELQQESNALVRSVIGHQNEVDATLEELPNVVSNKLDLVLSSSKQIQDNHQIILEKMSGLGLSILASTQKMDEGSARVFELEKIREDLMQQLDQARQAEMAIRIELMQSQTELSAANTHAATLREQCSDFMIRLDQAGKLAQEITSTSNNLRQGEQKAIERYLSSEKRAEEAEAEIREVQALLLATEERNVLLRSHVEQMAAEVADNRQERARERENTAQAIAEALASRKEAEIILMKERKAKEELLMHNRAAEMEMKMTVEEKIDRAAKAEGQVIALEKRISEQDVKISNLQQITATQKQKAAQGGQKLAEVEKKLRDMVEKERNFIATHARLVEMEARLRDQDALETGLKSSQENEGKLRREVTLYQMRMLDIEREVLSMKETLVDRRLLDQANDQLGQSREEIALLRGQLAELQRREGEQQQQQQQNKMKPHEQQPQRRSLLATIKKVSGTTVKSSPRPTSEQQSPSHGSSTWASIHATDSSIGADMAPTDKSYMLEEVSFESFSAAPFIQSHDSNNRSIEVNEDGWWS